MKLDGWRVQVRVEDGRATIRTRKGLDYTGSFPDIAKAARGLLNCIIDGEVCAIGKDGVSDFSALQAAMKNDRTEKLVLFAFDLLWLGDEDLRARPLVVRKKQLRDFLEESKDQKQIRFIDHLDATGGDVLDIACAMKLEGIVSKRLTDPYVSGRAGTWTKAKCRTTQHAWIGGWTYSDKGFSGLLLGVRKGRKLIPIGRVGTGFPRHLLDWLEPRLVQLEVEESPFSEPIARKPNREVHWAKPELIAGIEMTSWTQGRLIRQASLQEVRERTDRTLRPDWINLPGDNGVGT